MKTIPFENETVKDILDEIKAFIDVEGIEDEKIISITITTNGKDGFRGNINYL